MHVEGIFEASKKKKLFKEPPHLTFDNHFSGEEVCHYAGSLGFGLLTTLRRNRFPTGIKDEHLHKKPTDSSKRSKVARFLHPVIAVKTEESYDIVLTSFQSTSSCNIISVNSLNSNKNFVEARARGRGTSKRFYLIEQNAARLLYLKTYSRIDSIDHLIKNCNLGYCSWKYWHSPVNHAKGLAIATAYDIYLEVCEGGLDPAWKVEHPCDFFTFRDILSKQACQYDPRMQKYPGDEKMRCVTQLSKKRRVETLSTAQKHVPPESGDGTGRVTYDQYKQAKQNSTRFCLDLTSYGPHLQRITSSKSPAKCVVCGILAYKRCNECNKNNNNNNSGVPIHCMDKKGAGKDMNYHIIWHDSSYFGLCYADRNLVGKTTTSWERWTQTELRNNKKVIKEYEKRRR